ncbi:MAG: NUDIX domain-containing protein [Ginsengibacter sp.]
MKPIICAGGFLVKKNKFLFGKRSKKKIWAAGMWDIVGGKSLKNENPLHTLNREVQEETGVNVLDAELMTTMNIYDEKDGGFFTYHIYMITQWQNKPVNLTKEHTELRWFTRDEIGKLNIALPEYVPLIDKWITNSKTGLHPGE